MQRNGSKATLGAGPSHMSQSRLPSLTGRSLGLKPGSTLRVKPTVTLWTGPMCPSRISWTALM